MVIDESKIDSFCPNSQFNFPGYSLHQSNRKNGGGGLLVYVSSDLVCKRIVLERSYNTIEPTVLDIQLKSRNMLVIGKY